MIKLQAGTLFTSQVMCCQVHAVGKATILFSLIWSHILCTQQKFYNNYTDAINLSSSTI